MRKNRLRELLDAGKPSIGTHVITPWPGMMEIVGNSGAFDYVEWVGEYSPFSINLMENMARALELYPNMSSMMKVEEQTRGFIAQRSIDAGIQNVLFTDVRTADDARECVRLVRSERPESGGIHGTGMRRAAGWVLEGGSKAWCDAMDEVVVALMIEKVPAMKNLEAILQVEGVDMLQFGPSDYSISAGVPGKGGSAEIQADQKQMVKMALEAGVAPRIETGSFEGCKPWLDLGVTHFCIGWDIATVYRWCKAQAAGMKELMPDWAPGQGGVEAGSYGQ